MIDRRVGPFRPGGRREPDPEPSHGTRARYQRGCTCLPCKASEAAYRAKIRQQHREGKPPLGTMMSAVEAWRRIRQLKIEGISRRELSKRLGLHPRTLRVHPEFVRLKTILRIRHIYRQLVLTEGPDAHV